MVSNVGWQSITHELWRQMTNRTSVPNVFINGKSYGGMNDGPGISKMHAKAELVPLLRQAGVL